MSTLKVYARCVDGAGRRTKHDADGWLRDPSGRRISPMCDIHAQEVIDEYREKLDENWSFQYGEKS